MTIDIFPDNNTSVQLNESYIKDKDYVYFIKGKRVYSDFEIEELKSQMDDYYGDEAYKRLLFSEDSDGAYYDSVDISEMKQQGVDRHKAQKKIEAMKNLENITYLVVEGADIETFEVLNNEYGKDKNSLYHKNIPCDKLILSTYWGYNPIEPINTDYYQLGDLIFQQIENPESFQIVGHYNTNSCLLKDENYVYLYFLDEEVGFAEKLKKIFHFPKPNHDILEVYNYNSWDCYIKGNGIIYNYYEEDGVDYFSIVEGVDFETFNGWKDKFHRYECGKIDDMEYGVGEVSPMSDSKTEEVSIEDIPF